MAGDFAGPDMNTLLGDLATLTDMLLRLRGDQIIPKPDAESRDLHKLVMEVSAGARDLIAAAETIEDLGRPLKKLLTEEGHDVLDGHTLPAGLTHL